MAAATNQIESISNRIESYSSELNQSISLPFDLRSNASQSVQSAAFSGSSIVKLNAI